MNFISKRAKRLTPYTAGEQPKDIKYIKLNTNENPYPPSPKIYAEITMSAANLHLYSDPKSSDLCAAIASTENVDADCVFCGNGSDEVLSFAFYAFFDDNLPLLFPDVTYSFYPVFAKFHGISTNTLPLNERFQINIEDYLQAACGVIFPNPNAPTGVYLEPNKICKLLEYHSEKVVVVDEAYIAFGGQSVAPLINEYPNLLVVRTFSKSHSLAGLRVGYALGQPHLIEGLMRVKDSFNSYPVDRIASATAKAAILDTDYYVGINRKVAVTRDRFSTAMTGLGFNVLPSQANFIFVSHTCIPAKDLFFKLKDSGILVRYFNMPRIDNFLRISIGTDEDMDKFVEVIRKLLN
jgi:histidinol-phosphate aminotransferase